MMKKLMLAMALALLLPTSALAAEYGVYVAPKLGYGYAIMDNMKTTESFDYAMQSLSFEDDGNDDVFFGGLAIGYDFKVQHDLPLRAEIEYMYYGQIEDSFSKSHDWYGEDVKLKSKYDIQTLFANFYFDIYTDTMFTPYVGGGLGLAFVDAKGSFEIDDLDLSVTMGKKSQTNFAWNLGAGLGMGVTENLTLDLNYRFAGLGEAKTKTVSEGTAPYVYDYKQKTSELYMHQVILSLRWTF